MLLISYLRTGYPWLITTKDENPKFSQKGLKKFLKHGYDPELGWVRKPNTSGREQGRNGEVHYSIDEKGARTNVLFGGYPSIISCYGDSFAFCRQVNDDQTWEHYLSAITQTNVLNFGVGNYGLDQALLRLKRNYKANPTKVVMLAVVPETISRVLNVWKHYHEYGNIFGFKPRFKVENDELILINNVIDSPAKFQQIQTYFSELRKNDYFYYEKFKKDILEFPYTWSLARTCKRNVPLIGRLIIKEIYDLFNVFTGYEQHLHNESVLKRNMKLCAKLYQEKDVMTLMDKIMQDYAAYAKEKDFIPVFVMLPQYNDIIYTQKYGCYYQDFVEMIKRRVNVFDLTEGLLKHEDLGLIFSNDKYGGHLSKEGNKFVASVIAEKLKEKALLPSIKSTQTMSAE